MGCQGYGSRFDEQETTCDTFCSGAHDFGFDHINRNAPVLIRTPKLTRFEPAQYCGGGHTREQCGVESIFTLDFSFHFDAIFSFFPLPNCFLTSPALALFCHAFDVCEVVFRVCLVPP